MVSVFHTSETKDPFLGLCIRNMWLLTAHWDIDLTVKHISGTKNRIVDTLSRVYSDNPVNLQLWEDIQQNYLCEQVDTFTLTLTYICNFRS